MAPPYFADDPPYLTDGPPPYLADGPPIVGWWPPLPILAWCPPPPWLDDVLSQVGFSSVCVKAGLHETCAAGTSFHSRWGSVCAERWNQYPCMYHVSNHTIIFLTSKTKRRRKNTSSVPVPFGIHQNTENLVHPIVRVCCDSFETVFWPGLKPSKVSMILFGPSTKICTVQEAVGLSGISDPTLWKHLIYVGLLSW